MTPIPGCCSPPVAQLGAANGASVLRVTPWHAPLWFALALPLCGCGLRERTSQCNALAETVTAGVTPIKALLEREPRLTAGDASPAHYRELAALYAQLSVDLSDLSLADETLSDIQAGYAALYQETATTCEQLASAPTATPELKPTDAMLGLKPADAATLGAPPTRASASPPAPTLAPSSQLFVLSSPSALPEAAPSAASGPPSNPTPAKLATSKFTHQASSRSAQATQLNRQVRRQDGLAARVKLHCQQH